MDSTKGDLSLRRIQAAIWCDLDYINFIPFAIAGGVVLSIISSILYVNHGMFVYALDDPYITLALAEHLRHWHYGLNVGEAAAPSSSILFPFLLATPVIADARALAPLAINLAATAATVLLITRMLADVGKRLGPGQHMAFTLLISLIVVAAVPLNEAAAAAR